MSVTQQSLQKSNTAASFITSLATNGGLLALQVGVFVFLKGRLQRVYSPRTFLPPPDKRSDALPRGPWKWFAALMTIPTQDIIHKNGLDAYLFIRFLTLMIAVFAVFTGLTFPSLLVADYVGIPDNEGRDGLARLSWGNVPSNQQVRYWAHIAVAWILTFFVIYLIRREYGIFCTLRHQFLVSHSHSKLAQSKTVLIVNLPDSVQTEADLKKLLTFVPGGIRRIWIYRQTGELPKMFNTRNKYCTKLEKAECGLLRQAIKAKRAEDKMHRDADNKARNATKKLKQTDETDKAQTFQQVHEDIERAEGEKVSVAFQKVQRPTHRLGKVPFIGKKVDSISWYKEEIAHLSQTIEEARRNLKHDPSHGSAFVECNLQLGANILSQVIVSDEPLRMYDKWTDVAPRDIVWANIDDSGYEMRARFVTSWIATIGLIVLWSFPVSFVGMLSNVADLCVRVTWLAWLCRLPVEVQGIISGLLPPVFLAILLALLPYILKGLAWYENIPRYSLISLSVYKRYFMFLVIHGFLIITLSSGLTAAVPQILNNPPTAVESLAERLPDASTFFLTYVTTTGLTGAASALLQAAALVLYFLNRWLFGDTPRQAYKKTFSMPSVDFGVVLPRMSLIAAIAIAYSVIAPIINALALLSFILLWIAWKFLFIWVYDQPESAETGGLYYPLALNNIFIGLYIEQICLAALFFLNTDAQGKRSSIPQGCLMVVLLAITFTAQLLFMNMYGPIIKNLPTALSTKKIQEKHERKQRGEHLELLPDLFSRDKVRGLVRRKLKLDAKPVDAHAIIAEEQRKEEVKVEEKQQEAKENVHDLELLAAVVRSSYIGGPSSSAAPIATGQPEAPWSNTTAVGHSSSLERPSDATAYPPQHVPASLEENVQDDWDSSDDEMEDNSFNHPSTYQKAPIVWVPQDDLGLSKYLVDELLKAGVNASDVGAFMDRKGNVDVSRNPPDEEWSGGHDV